MQVERSEDVPAPVDPYRDQPRRPSRYFFFRSGAMVRLDLVVMLSYMEGKFRVTIQDGRALSIDEDSKRDFIAAMKLWAEHDQLARP